MTVLFNNDRLQKHLSDYLRKIATADSAFARIARERRDRVVYYQSWTADRLRAMSEEDLLEYLSKLWAMLIWGNKQYVVDKLIAAHGLETVRMKLPVCFGMTPLSRRDGTGSVVGSRVWVRR